MWVRLPPAQLKYFTMTKKELDQRTDEELTPSENALINFNIYHSPDHVEYYQKYQIGDYKWCYDYLIANRHLLTLEHTPANRKELATRAVEMAQLFFKR